MLEALRHCNQRLDTVQAPVAAVAAEPQRLEASHTDDEAPLAEVQVLQTEECHMALAVLLRHQIVLLALP